MKKLIAILLVLNICLAAGCVSNVSSMNAGRNNGIQKNSSDVPSPAAVVAQPEYRLNPKEDSVNHIAEDETLLFSGSYQWLELEVVNLDQLSPQGQEQARRSCEVFKTRMAEMRAAAMSQNAEIAVDAEMAVEQGYQGPEFTDETTMDGVFLGQIISVQIDNYNYYGGAHPNRYTGSLTFDLAAGQFIDPIQIADDPEKFRSGAAALLVEKADSMGEEYIHAYWEDYRDIIARWNEGTVLFGDKGMTVHYSPYEIGPYAVGDLDFVVSYGVLEELIGAGGMDKLGLPANE